MDNLFLDRPVRSEASADSGARALERIFIDGDFRGRLRRRDVGAVSLDLDEAPGFECADEVARLKAVPPIVPEASVPAVARGAAGDVGASRAAGSAPSPRPATQAPPYSIAQESYRAELAYDRKRARSHKASRILRVVALVVLVPVLLVAVFLASYALTCILNGATPEDLAQLMGSLFARIEGAAGGVARALGSKAGFLPSPVVRA